jgi:hypothetical protein
VYIFCCPGLASCRWLPLSSNVRPHKCAHSRSPFKMSAMQLAFVQKALPCQHLALTPVRLQAFGAPSTARLLVTHRAVGARFVRGGAVRLLDAVLTFGRAELLNTSCA